LRCAGIEPTRPLPFRYHLRQNLATSTESVREDENLRIGQSTLQEIVRDFADLIVKEFGKDFLNSCPNKEEREALSRINGGRGFRGMLASWDCKHFQWQNCPMRWAGQHQGHSDGGKRTLILEAIADHRKYFWYANFGDAGSLNDINVLDKSSMVGAMLSGTLSIKIDDYEINGNTRDWMYFLSLLTLTNLTQEKGSLLQCKRELEKMLSVLLEL
jgi:Plant transposon protein